jgi:hypothetical protein
MVKKKVVFSGAASLTHTGEIAGDPLVWRVAREAMGQARSSSSGWLAKTR